MNSTASSPSTRRAGSIRRRSTAASEKRRSNTSDKGEKNTTEKGDKLANDKNDKTVDDKIDKVAAEKADKDIVDKSVIEKAVAPTDDSSTYTSPIPPLPVPDSDEARALSNAMFAAALAEDEAHATKRANGASKNPPRSRATRAHLRRTMTFARSGVENTNGAPTSLAEQDATSKTKTNKAKSNSPVAGRHANTNTTTPPTTTTPTTNNDNVAAVEENKTNPNANIDTASSTAASNNGTSSSSSPLAQLQDFQRTASLLSSSGNIEESGGIIYITRDVDVVDKKPKVLVIDPARIAREKAERQAELARRLERQAERDRKKAEEIEEKRKKEAEAAAAKEATRIAREKMTNMLSEQAKQRRLEEAERAAAVAAANASDDRRSRAGAASLRRRNLEAEAEARRKVAREMNPDYEPEEGETEAGESHDDDHTAEQHQPITSQATRRQMRASVAPIDLLTKKMAPRPPKAAKKLIPPRLINAAKKGDIDEAKKILVEEFGKLAHAPSCDKPNKNGETRSEFLNRVDKNGSSVLHHAVWPGHAHFMSYMLQQGANVNLQNTRLNTVMHLAVERGHGDVIRLLLRYGADPTLVNSNGCMPFQVVPNVKEQLHWASFLYMTLEAIWKTANPGWVPEEEDDIDEDANSSTTPITESATAAVAAGTGTEDAGMPLEASSSAVTLRPFHSHQSSTDANSAGSQTPDVASPGGDAAYLPDGDNDDPTGTPPIMIPFDTSHDYTPLTTLNPWTPQWLSELLRIFRKKDSVRTRTRSLQSKMLSIMRMGLLRGATMNSNQPTPIFTSGSPQAMETPSSFTSDHLPSQPSSARSTLVKTAGGNGANNGLANLLHKMKLSGKNSQRSSIEVGVITPTTASRRSSQEVDKTTKVPMPPTTSTVSVTLSPITSPPSSSAIQPMPSTTLFPSSSTSTLPPPTVTTVKTMSIFSMSLKEMDQTSS